MKRKDNIRTTIARIEEMRKQRCCIWDKPGTYGPLSKRLKRLLRMPENTFWQLIEKDETLEKFADFISK